MTTRTTPTEAEARAIFDEFARFAVSQPEVQEMAFNNDEATFNTWFAENTRRMFIEFAHMRQVV